MCGIAGIWDRRSKKPVDETVLRRMVKILHHRGPDDDGTFISNDVGLGHTRLSIVDLSGGHQPMSNEDGSLWIVYNGEIYNHHEIRTDLIKKGHTFRTKSDTEVIIHLYEEAGEDCVNSFNGQFSFCIWDCKKRKLFLARDRMGVRPLFYSNHNGRFLFGSEIKSLFEDPDLPREIDIFALDQVFTFWFPIPPRTGFVGVSELPPGHRMIVRENNIEISSYWKIDFPTLLDSPNNVTPHDKWYSDGLTELLDNAIMIRLRADVPVGSYLSGGLDSSVITALARRHIDDHLKTFSIGFEANDYDETQYQKMVVDHLKTDHYHFLCKTSDIGRYLPTAIWHIERPIIRTAPVPLMLLAKGVRESGIKVVLTGEGADEILAGYDIFKENKVRRFWANIPKSKKRPALLRKLYPYLSEMKGQASNYLNAFFGQGLENTDDPFYSHRPRWQVTSQLKGLYSDRVREELKGYDPIDELRAQLPDEFVKWHPLSQAQYLETAFLLPGYILSSQGDRMSMAQSVEGRFPFLDHRVVEFAAKIPPNLKLKVLNEKYVLREASKDLLPQPILQRKKQPYRAPDHTAIFPKKDGVNLTDNFLCANRLNETGIFSAPPINALISRCQRNERVGTKDSMALVGSLSVQILYNQFIKKSNIPT